MMNSSDRFLRLAAVLLLILALGFGVVAQESKPAPSQSQSQPVPQQKQKKDVPGVGVQVEDAEKTITPEEAKELLGAVDAILAFDSKDTALPIKHEVKRQLASRDQVQRYLESHMKSDKDTQRLQRSAVVLQKFGLLPHDFDLKSYLIELLREQVAGYYDPKTKTVYLLNWVGPAGQKGVMAHELTHALQDQSFDLEKWLKDPDTKTLQQEIEADEQMSARHAVVEGQAMIPLIDFELAPDQSVVSAPLIVEALRNAMMLGLNSPVFQKAPLFIKEALTFPYNYGLNFEREVLVKGGKEAAFAGVFRNPPPNTRQVMEPAAYLSGEKLPPLPVPDYDKLLGKDYKRFDVGSIGEFDVSVLAKQYEQADAAKAIAPQWRGGYYYAARPKKGDPNALALVFVTKWGNPETARRFADIYSSFVPKRYASAQPEGDPPVRRWTTAEGPVSVEVQGDTLLVMESLSDAAAAKVRNAVFGGSNLSRLENPPQRRGGAEEFGSSGERSIGSLLQHCR